MFTQRRLQQIHGLGESGVIPAVSIRSPGNRRHHSGVALRQRLTAVGGTRGGQQGLDSSHLTSHLADPAGRTFCGDFPCGDQFVLAALKLPAPGGAVAINGALGAAEGGAGLVEKTALLEFQSPGRQGFGVIAGHQPDLIKQHPVAAETAVQAEGCGSIGRRWCRNHFYRLNLRGRRGQAGTGRRPSLWPEACAQKSRSPGWDCG